MDVRDCHGMWVLVTGAASGIGRETALLFARRGADLAICDVNEAGLGETAEAARGEGRKVLARTVDVADAAAMGAFAEEVLREAGPPRVLMNNAGVGLGASFQDTSLEDWEWILGINVRGVVHGCHAFVPAMVERGGPAHVVNVSSAAGYLPSEILCAYTTTKYAVLGLSEALRMELRRHGIGVTAVCPGIIDTPIVRTSRLRGAAGREGMREEMVRAYHRRGYGPERVAEKVLLAIQRGRTVAPIAPEAWVMYYLKRLAPGLVWWLGERATRRQLAGGD
jgi:NAD(P)-dependent dehydrogenase (short-subunit alcohol dehydrogenase family)